VSCDINVVVGCEEPKTSEEMHDYVVFGCTFYDGIDKAKVVAKEVHLLPVQ